MIDAARAELPELPADRAARYEAELGLPPDLARQHAYRAELGAYFEAAVAAAPAGVEPRVVANWTGNELVARIGDGDPGAAKVTPQALAALVGLVGEGAVTGAGARTVLDRLVAHGGDPEAIVAAEGLGALGDDDGLGEIVAAALAAHPDAAEKVRAGNLKALGPIVGQVMRETKGRADGGEVQRLVREQLAG